MIKILHCSDLHLSEAEKNYSLSVLSEIVDIANREKVDFLVFSGDVFDRFTEITKLQDSFDNIISRLDCEVYLIPGNHEMIDKGNKEFTHIFNKCHFLYNSPYDFRDYRDIEFLIIPHQNDYAGYENWNVPKKISKYRVAIAHGVVPEFVPYVSDEEEGGMILDSDIFIRHAVDYVALGHLHKCRESLINNTIFAYPGSARVWRKGEEGSRGCFLIELEDTIKTKFIEIKSSGRYIEYNITLSIDGECEDIGELAKEWVDKDYIHINFSGIVDDAVDVKRKFQNLKKDLEKNVRRLEFDYNGISDVSGISKQPIAKKFLELWNKKKQLSDGTEDKILFRARELGLELIKNKMEEIQ